MVVFNVLTSGAVGNGTTDDSAAFIAVRNAMQASASLDPIDAASNVVKATRAIGYTPTGKYRITRAEALMGLTDDITNGWEIQGAGQRATTTIWARRHPRTSCATSTSAGTSGQEHPLPRR